MEKNVMTAFKRGIILFIVAMVLTYLASSPEIKNSGFSGIMWFFVFIVFVGALGLIATAWGTHLKSKIDKKK